MIRIEKKIIMATDRYGRSAVYYTIIVGDIIFSKKIKAIVAHPSLLMLVAARLRHIAGTKWSRRCYLCMDTLIRRILITRQSLNPDATTNQKVRKNIDTSSREKAP